MKKIIIGNRIIGKDESCFIIAEAGLNHDGEFAQAKELIKKAVKVGVDAIKFQTYKTEKFIRKGDKNFALFKSLELRDKDWIDLSKLAQKLGIIFFSSVWDEDSVDLLARLNALAYKIGSADLTNLPLLSYVARKKKPIILSTGMSEIKEIEEALNVIYSTGNKNVALLHCISRYPADYKELNLLTIKTMKDKFRVPVGFSDHTIGITGSLAAVALGANIIEKHFTLDKNLPGPDHKLSLEPDEFREMIDNIRLIEEALGDGIKKPTKIELKIRKLARRSIVSNTKIPERAKITENMLKLVRPGTGIEPRFINKIIGKIAKKEILEDEIIKWSKIL